MEGVTDVGVGVVREGAGGGGEEGGDAIADGLFRECCPDGEFVGVHCVRVCVEGSIGVEPGEGLKEVASGCRELWVREEGNKVRNP